MRRCLVSCLLLAATLIAPASVRSQVVRACALYTPAPPPAEGVLGTVFVAQVPGACGGEETNYRVVIDWGDGTPAQTDLRPEPLGGGVAGRHAFRRSGTYRVTATVTDVRTGEQRAFRRAVRIANQPLRRGPQVTVRDRSGPIARFRDGNPLAEPGDFTARVRIGRRTYRGQVFRDKPSGFTVLLDRLVPAGARRAVVRITDGRGAELTITSRVR